MIKNVIMSALVVSFASVSLANTGDDLLSSIANRSASPISLGDNNCATDLDVLGKMNQNLETVGSVVSAHVWSRGELVDVRADLKDVKTSNQSITLSQRSGFFRKANIVLTLDSKGSVVSAKASEGRTSISCNY